MLAKILELGLAFNPPFRLIRIPKPVITDLDMPRETLGEGDELRDTDLIDDGFGPTPLTKPPFQYVGLTKGKMVKFMKSFKSAGELREATLVHLEKCVEAAHPNEKDRIMTILNDHSLIPNHVLRKIFLIQGALTWTMRRYRVVPRQRYPPKAGEQSGPRNDQSQGQVDEEEDEAHTNAGEEEQEPRSKGEDKEAADAAGEEKEEETKDSERDINEEGLSSDAPGEYEPSLGDTPSQQDTSVLSGDDIEAESNGTGPTAPSSDMDISKDSTNDGDGDGEMEGVIKTPPHWNLTIEERTISRSHSTFEEYYGANEPSIPERDRGKYHYNYNICLSTQNKYIVPHLMGIRWTTRFMEYATEDKCSVGLLPVDGGKPTWLTKDNVPILRHDWRKYMTVYETSKRGDGYYMEFRIRTNLSPHSSHANNAWVKYDRFHAHMDFTSNMEITELFSIGENPYFTPIILIEKSNLSDGLETMKTDLIQRLNIEAKIKVDPKFIQIQWRYENINDDECWAALVLASPQIDETTVHAIRTLPVTTKVKYETTWNYVFHLYHDSTPEDQRSDAIKCQSQYLEHRRYMIIDGMVDPGTLNIIPPTGQYTIDDAKLSLGNIIFQSPKFFKNDQGEMVPSPMIKVNCNVDSTYAFYNDGDSSLVLQNYNNIWDLFQEWMNPWEISNISLQIVKASGTPDALCVNLNDDDSTSADSEQQDEGGMEKEQQEAEGGARRIDRLAEVLGDKCGTAIKATLAQMDQVAKDKLEDVNKSIEDIVTESCATAINATLAQAMNSLVGAMHGQRDQLAYAILENKKTEQHAQDAIEYCRVIWQQ